MIGCWHDNVVSLSVLPSVTLCFVDKRYIIQQKCLNKWIGSAPYEPGFYNFPLPAPTLSPQTSHLLNHRRRLLTYCCDFSKTRQFKELEFFWCWQHDWELFNNNVVNNNKVGKYCYLLLLAYFVKEKNTVPSWHYFGMATLYKCRLRYCLVILFKAISC